MTRIADLRLPNKFTAWRPGQEETIDAIVKSQKKVFLLDAPTGAGKSLTAIATHQRLTVMDEVLGRLANDDHVLNARYITRTMQLQEQVRADFPTAAVIRGRSNYPCAFNPKLTAADCPRACSLSCEYKTAKLLASKAPVAVLNDAYFLTEINGPGLFSGSHLVILDEVDSLENSLFGVVQLTVSEQQAKKYGLEYNLPTDQLNIQQWIVWAERAWDALTNYILGLKSQLPITIPDWDAEDMRINKEVITAQSFQRKLQQFIEEVDDSWLIDIETKTRGWQAVFKPVTVGYYAEQYLWLHGKRFLGMSGTILDPEILADDLGLAPDDYEYLRNDSQFPVANRLVRFRPVANLKYANMETELPKLSKEISDIIKENPGQNVLVHTTSNKVRDYLLYQLPEDGIDRLHLMTHDTDNRSERLLQFKAGRGKVMISPSFDRGVDLPDDECRVNIIAKTPFLNLSDKQVKARLALPRGQRWYNLRAIQSVMQMTGRAVRSDRDYAKNYILDSQFNLLLARTRHLLPKWWLDSIVRE